MSASSAYPVRVSRGVGTGLIAGHLAGIAAASVLDPIAFAVVSAGLGVSLVAQLRAHAASAFSFVIDKRGRITLADGHDDAQVARGDLLPAATIVATAAGAWHLAARDSLSPEAARALRRALLWGRAAANATSAADRRR